jgi:hypothetical protein
MKKVQQKQPKCMKVSAELPTDFNHKPPKGMHYEQLQFKSNVVAIWTVYDRRFDYNNGDTVRCIWGFHNSKTGEYFAPINSSTMGSLVDINKTTPYSAMQLQLKGLEQFFV